MFLHRTAALLLGGCSLFFGTADSPSTVEQNSLVGHPAAQHVGPPQLYPDPDLTPGKADTVDIEDLTDRWECPASIHKVDCTYSQSHRSVSRRVHTRSMRSIRFRRAREAQKAARWTTLTLSATADRTISRTSGTSPRRTCGMGRTSGTTRRTVWRAGCARKSRRANWTLRK